MYRLYCVFQQAPIKYRNDQFFHSYFALSNDCDPIQGGVSQIEMALFFKRFAVLYE